MTQATPLLNESSATTLSFRDERASLKVVGMYSVESSTTDVGYCEVVVVDQSRPREQVPPNHVSIEDLEARLSKVPGMPDELASARKWVADVLYPSQVSLRSLRLARGLTQTMLAGTIGTSQPHLARMENGQSGIMRDTMRRLCEALNVDMNTLDKALQACGSDA